MVLYQKKSPVSGLVNQELAARKKELLLAQSSETNVIGRKIREHFLDAIIKYPVYQEAMPTMFGKELKVVKLHKNTYQKLNKIKEGKKDQNLLGIPMQQSQGNR